MVIKKHVSKLHSKFKEHASTAIITAFGLVTALAWKDVVTDFVSKITPAQNLLLTAVIITIISIICIAIVSRWAQSQPKNKDIDKDDE